MSNIVFEFEVPESFNPWEFAREVGIHPDSTKEFFAAVEEDEEIVAVLFTGRSADCYSFDIAVEPGHQGKGHGSALMDLAINEYENLLMAIPELEFCLDAVNPIAVRMLKQRGFEITRERGEHTYLTRRGRMARRVAQRHLRRH